MAIVGIAPALRADPAADTRLLLRDAWVRAMPPGQVMTAGYLQLENPGTETVTITGATAASGKASLHETRTVDGRSSMRAVDTLTLRPGERVHFQPGGLHIMLMGLERVPAEGETIALCIETGGASHCIDAAVRRGPPPDASSNTKHHHQH